MHGVTLRRLQRRQLHKQKKLHYHYYGDSDREPSSERYMPSSADTRTSSLDGRTPKQQRGNGLVQNYRVESEDSYV